MLQQVRLRIRNLRSLRKLGKEHDNPKSLLDLSPAEIRNLEQQLPPSQDALRLENLDNDELTLEAAKARDWLLQILGCHDTVLAREQQMQVLTRAVQKELAGKGEERTEIEALYFALTNEELATPKDRLKAGFALVLHFNFAERLKHVRSLAKVRTDRIGRISTIEAEEDVIFEKIYERVSLSTVDHFACAVSLSQASSTSPSLVDDNAGCCPICHCSYTDLCTYPARDLLSDFPARIKYCGHIVGKACLEQWMTTPKIDEAKYPHRTCPLCRVKIEGVAGPSFPDGLLQHLKSTRRGHETVRELVYGWDLDLADCMGAVVGCMSDEIATEALLEEISKRRTDSGDHKSLEEGERILRERMEELRKEKWLWGFRGSRVWSKLRDDWRNSGTVRTE